MSILCYHEVDPTWQSTLSVTPEAFRAQCRWLSKRRVLSLDEAAPMVAAKGRMPRGASSITFDDGFVGVGEHAWPILKEFALPATVFVVADTVAGGKAVDWVDGTEPGVLRTLTREQVQRLASEGMTIGSHSRSHHDLTTLTETEVFSDLLESRQILEDLIGRPVSHLAYPRGRHNAMVRDAAGRAGYAWGHALPETNEVGGQWAVPRVGVYPGNGLMALRIKSAPLYARLRTSSMGPRLSRLVQSVR